MGVVCFTPRPLYPKERTPHTNWIRGWVGPRTGLNDVEKRKISSLTRLELDPSAIQPVASSYTD
jgi:hypothetical protein